MGVAEPLAKRSAPGVIRSSMSVKTSYSQILKSSSVMGAAAGVNLLLGMVRTKFAAVLIGATGVGLLTSFTAIQGMVGTLFGLGIQSSAVREVAAAIGKGDQVAIGRTIRSLQRVCCITGLAGMLVMVLLSPQISRLTLGSEEYVWDIAALGIVILLTNITSGQMALMQGMRRIADMARVNVLSGVLATVTAVGFYFWLGLRGIVPAMVIAAMAQIALSWFYARHLPVLQVSMRWRETFHEAGSMVRLGLVFMWNGLMGSALSYVTVMLITKQIGLPAVGLYGAAFALSGMFVGFVLGAMGADYYPRLTGIVQDKAAMNRLVNEQTEIGVLLAAPGLLATLALAPWIVSAFYTSEFLPAVNLLQWFVLGCLGRVISWPLGFVMLALSKGGWFLATETVFTLAHLLLIMLGLHFFGIEGVAVAFALMYVGYTLTVCLVARHLIEFEWSADCVKTGVVALVFLVAAFIVARSLALWPATVAGALLTVGISIYSVRGLAQRIGHDHRVFLVLSKVPGLKMLCGL